jgi:hypothetical protein
LELPDDQDMPITIVAAYVVSSSLFILGIVAVVVAFKRGWLRCPSKSNSAQGSVADSTYKDPEKLGVQGKRSQI